jgi:hypothetical protein
MVYNESQGLDKVFKVVLGTSAALCLAVGISTGVMALTDAKLTLATKIFLFVFLFCFVGLLVPVWLVTLKIRVEVTVGKVKVTFWPLESLVIEKDSIVHAEVVTIDPLRDFGGWGIKGTRANRLYALTGISAVRIKYSAKGEERLVTCTSKNSEAFVGALRM